MNAPRRKQVVALPDSHEFAGWTGLVKKHLNNLLTVILVIAAVAMFIRWRMRTGESARSAIANELVSARNQVNQLQQVQLAFLPSQELLRNVQAIQNAANSAISNVLSSSDANARLRASALILRGDLYWDLANLPPLPGSATQPSLALSDSSDVLLQKAWDAYQEVLKNSTYSDQSEQLASARLGVADIYENRGDWAAAKNELQAIVDNAKAPDVLIGVAKVQLNQLPQIQKKTYMVPPAGVGAAAAVPASRPAVAPAFNLSPSLTLPTIPATNSPTTKFVLPDFSLPIKPSTTMP